MEQATNNKKKNRFSDYVAEAIIYWKNRKIDTIRDFNFIFFVAYPEADTR